MTALLPIDFETTGLTPRATILEASWCITNLDGTQRLPLRSRYCAFSTSDVVTPQSRNPNGCFWTPEGVGDRTALRMAEESGLFDDWLACPDSQILTSGKQLERLILDDVAAVCDLGSDDHDPERVHLAGASPGRDPERVHLAGAGAARFDFDVLARHCPGVVPYAGATAPLHYRPVDTSGNQTGLLGGTMDEELITWAFHAYEFGSNGNITSIKVGSPPQYAFPRELNVMSKDKPHRAPEDVARSIVIQRALWRFAAPLREALTSPR